MQQLPDLAEDERSLQLPARCTSSVAEDLRVRLVLAIDLDHEIIIDASEVETLGQAVLQLLLAAHAEADAAGQRFLITSPSRSFSERVAACGLADVLGIPLEEDLSQ